MSLKKIYLPNQCYFITTNVFEFEPLFGKIENGIYIPNKKLCQIIIDVINYNRKCYKYFLNGYVIMPDHLHLMLTTAGDESPATRLEDYRENSLCAGRDVCSNVTHAGGDISSYVSRVGGDLSPRDRNNISEIMRAIKGRSARLINQELKKSGPFWQEDFYEHAIRNEQDFTEKMNYTHNNPVKANFVKNPGDFKYSSFRNYYLNDDSLIAIDKI